MKKRSTPQKVFNVFNIIFLFLITLIYLLPYWIIVVASFTDEFSLKLNGYSIFTTHISFEAYKFIFGETDLVLRSLLNSVIITLGSSFAVLIVTGLYAYPLSRSNLKGKKFFSWLMIIPMLFSGGLIPTFVVTSFFFYNSLLALIIPGSFAAWYCLLMRNFFYSVPESLKEAAAIDGASEMKIYISIMIPLSVPIFMVIFLYSAVSAWNNWFGPLLYLDDVELYPLQYFVQQIISDVNSIFPTSGDSLVPIESVKMACVVVASLPLIVIYPFIQKYFVEGTSVGAVKE